MIAESLEDQFTYSPNILEISSISKSICFFEDGVKRKLTPEIVIPEDIGEVRVTPPSTPYPQKGRQATPFRGGVDTPVVDPPDLK